MVPWYYARTPRRVARLALPRGYDQALGTDRQLWSFRPRARQRRWVSTRRPPKKTGKQPGGAYSTDQQLGDSNFGPRCCQVRDPHLLRLIVDSRFAGSGVLGEGLRHSPRAHRRGSQGPPASGGRPRGKLGPGPRYTRGQEGDNGSGFIAQKDWRLASRMRYTAPP
jgi:hypothetical protein